MLPFEVRCVVLCINIHYFGGRSLFPPDPSSCLHHLSVLAQLCGVDLKHLL